MEYFKILGGKKNFIIHFSGVKFNIAYLNLIYGVIILGGFFLNNRPMLIITISYIIGIILGLYLEINIALFVVVLGLIIVVLVECICRKFLKNNSRKLIIISSIICILSFNNITFNEWKFDNLYKDIDGDFGFTGKIISVEKESKYYNNYLIKIDKIGNMDKFKGTRILLKVKKNKNAYLFEYGNSITGTGSFQKLSIARNYKGFDYSMYMKTKNVFISCKSDLKNLKATDKMCKNPIDVIKLWITRLRNRIKSNLFELLPEKSAKIAVAFLTGDTGLLSDDERQLFSDASLSHVLAISGMHVSYVILMLSFLLKKFDNRKGKYFCILFLIFFSNLTGCSPSIVRAGVMYGLVIVSKLIYRKSDSLNNVAISCLIILIYNPYNILNLGFQLSFLGTLGIILFEPKLKHKYDLVKNSVNKMWINSEKISYKGNKLLSKTVDKIVDILCISISANLLIMPILLYNYNNISFVFLISNMLVTPILGIMMLFGYTTVIVSMFSIKIAKIASLFANLCIIIFIKISEFCINIPCVRFLIVTPNLSFIIFYYIIVFYFFYFYNKNHKKILKKSLVIIIVLAIIFVLIANLNHGLKLYFVDVGQGDCSLIITEGNKRIIIDGGGSDSDEYDIGESVLVPYLLDRKIITIDYMIFSHFDSDHCKGLFTVMEKLNVKNAIINKQGEMSDNYKYFIKLAKSKGINVIVVKAGDCLRIDKHTTIDFLWPNDNLISSNILNNNSIVCKLKYKNTSILFTGDIEKIAEEELVKKYNNNELNANILKVAHHGSKTSSTVDFVDLVKPKIALIGVGANNKFGHPNGDVLERLKSAGAYIYRTDRCGEINVFINSRGNMRIKKYLED